MVIHPMLIHHFLPSSPGLILCNFHVNADAAAAFANLNIAPDRDNKPALNLDLLYVEEIIRHHHPALRQLWHIKQL